jgi:hypothetical protein
MCKSSVGRAAPRVALVLAMTLLLAGPVAAQSPAPPSLPLPTPMPTPTQDTGIEWPSMEFEGGSPDLLVFTSDCGVWGQDPITLHGQGAAGSAELVVTFSEYIDGDAQWFGRVTGTLTGPNGFTSPVDEGALIYYDFGTGHWILVASSAAQIPAKACDDASPAPSEGA